jgi:hypothetical protein
VTLKSIALELLCVPQRLRVRLTFPQDKGHPKVIHTHDSRWLEGIVEAMGAAESHNAEEENAVLENAADPGDTSRIQSASAGMMLFDCGQRPGVCAPRSAADRHCPNRLPISTRRPISRCAPAPPRQARREADVAGSQP